MPKLKGDPDAQDLTEIEEGKISKICFACKRPQKIAVCMYGLNSEIRSHSQMGVCENKSCFRYTDMSKVRTWIIE